MDKIILIVGLIIALASCQSETNEPTTEVSKTENKELNLYTHRHYDTDQIIFDNFEKSTGIKVNVVNANADELIQKMEREGAQSPADLLLTVDAGRLVRAKSKQLLQAIESNVLTETIPAHLRDRENNWFGLTKRARVVVYDKEKVKPEQLSTYENLVEPQWNKKF